ncbi:MAG: bifunctional adenosylcobinamide kinase/adenosylcobinamide-phosphate guanylyltransferase [Oscillospiraceae bacterium]
MSKSILITGGSASGKSRWAVTNYSHYDYVLYLRTGDAVDPDILHRIEYGNNQNGVEWDIVEGVTENPAEKIGDHKFVIMDRLNDYAEIVMDRMCPDIGSMNDEMMKSIERSIIADIESMRERIDELDGSMTIITLETGLSIMSDDPRQTALMRIIGVINQRIANTSNEVYFSASGIQFKIK